MKIVAGHPLKEFLKAVFPKKMKRKEKGKCPFCGRKVNQNEFRDILSKREFDISGLCQKCQDDFFG